jgi:hypothetical protein
VSLIDFAASMPGLTLLNLPAPKPRRNQRGVVSSPISSSRGSLPANETESETEGQDLNLPIAHAAAHSYTEESDYDSDVDNFIVDDGSEFEFEEDGGGYNIGQVFYSNTKSPGHRASTPSWTSQMPSMSPLVAP